MQSEEKFLKIGIIGLGLIGGSIAKGIKAANNNIIISAFDKPEVLSKALSEKIINVALSNYLEIVDCNIIFLCLPIEISIKVFDDLIPHLKENTIITDVCGVKYPFHKVWDEKATKGCYIGGHPMTGKEKGGYDNSDPLLFENSVFILTKSKNVKAEHVNTLSNIIKNLGARIRFLDPKLHDKVVAYVSHLPQLLAISLVNNLPSNEHNINFLDFAAGGFRDMTRIASSSYDIWKNVISFNKDEIIYSLNDLKNHIENIIKDIENDNVDNLNNKFLSAAIKRDSIPKNNKGFLSPIYDILVYVKDEPGVISKISTALFELNINIKDIELLKIREGDGGTFRLAFDSEEDASNAKKIMQKLGYRVN
ncbi:MAG TPA: prephenate dehydrogenase/arogenate dehydrogenase family protein [Ignavibacteriales bacterium]|nr:prephenate dehydrogenase/arogenate dehydrogenase family protein [Ignavibacteriales bacterium]HOL82214.1 prephenate dehydrogenase/arogenate dehydrogenase family protein [Ignavibacteriales bacterium]HOM65664.1 prephenate dehydrogenase/arogenate dehydrogenase family protein [Ignavibacteriales bacterium]HPD67360.1 prephenate dehydrogenase/arogenate dehydrogenase family protein [Ignavibacteriales bacterium]HPP32885.1 prephenate dehydrogenase/arogenate dehydrogenase family protein [Ignavibacterial